MIRHLSFPGRLIEAESLVFARLPNDIKIRQGKATITIDLFELEHRREQALRNDKFVTDSWWYYRLTPEHKWVCGGQCKTEAIRRALVERAQYDLSGGLYHG